VVTGGKNLTTSCQIQRFIFVWETEENGKVANGQTEIGDELQGDYLRAEHSNSLLLKPHPAQSD